MLWWNAGRRYVAGLVIASFGMAGCAMAAPETLCPELPPVQTKIRFRSGHFDLQNPEDLRRLDAVLDKEVWNTPFGEKDRDSMMEMRSLIARTFTVPDARCEALVELAEIGDSLDLDKRDPTPQRIDAFYAPFLYFDLMHNPVAKGTKPASNASRHSDPVESTFWSRPKNIASQNLYEPFGPILRVNDEICTYHEAKTSYGTTPGFTVKCRAGAIKVKFGENELPGRSTEVALARLFKALGYNVEPSDYAPRVLVRYDRSLLSEFNSRKSLDITITVLGFIPVYRKIVQTPQDPFRYIRSAVMKDGTVVSSEELASSLIRPDILERSTRAAAKHPKGTSSEHYRQDAAEFESRIDHLVMDEANVQMDDVGGPSIGPWSWDRLGHSERREVRGVALLFAWTNCFDVRWDNNRLKRDKNGLRHVISDLGNGLGRAENFKVDAPALVNEFPWTFTEAPVVDDGGRERKPFRIVSYQPVFGNDAFRDMTVDDARWMARFIAQLTESQMQQALIAAGYTSAEIRLYTAKLISRRDRMIQDLGLTKEIPLLRPQGIERVFDYDPRADGPIEVHTPAGTALRPLESRDLVIRQGRVEPR